MSRFTEDEEYARAMEESLRMSGQPPGGLFESDNPRYSAGSGRPRSPSADPYDPENRANLRNSMQRHPNLPVAGAIDEKTLMRQKTFSGSFFGKEKKIRPYFTYITILCCTILMGVELYYQNETEGTYFEEPQINPLFGPSLEVLLFMGAKQGDLIVNENEWWRLFMPMFLHGGILHLLFNMAFLYSFGVGLEKEFGHYKVAYIYLTSGFFGVLCSAIFNPTIPSVGASGACYGLIGAAWADFILNFSFYKDQWKCVLSQLMFGTTFNVLLGMIPQLDNFAHVGGLIAGLITGLSVLTLPRYDMYEDLKPDKMYQICLKSIAIFITPILIIIFVIVLYLGVDVEEHCPGCEYISCVPTPFWECGISCLEGFELKDLTTNTTTVVCPRDIGEKIGQTFPDVNTLATDQNAQIAFCEKFCLGK